MRERLGNRISMDYTERKNINRGYMKLDVWRDAVELFRSVTESISRIDKLEFRLRGQILDAAQSVSANIAEGYCRRSINEYLYFLNVALGSLGELMTRVIGLHASGIIPKQTFDSFDEFHYRVENKLLALLKALQGKRKDGTWEQELREPKVAYLP